MYEDHPGVRMHRELMKALYQYNKMRVDIAGTVESIAEITAEVLYKCYKTFYNLRNMTLAICGDVDIDKIESILDKVLKEAEPFEIERDTEDQNEPKEVYKKKTICKLDVSKPLFSIGIKDTDIPACARERARKAYATEILDEMLFSQSSSFYNELYSENLISQDLSSGCEIGKNYSFNVISSESSDPDLVYTKFLEYIEKTKKEGLDKETFELSKRTVYASNIKSFDSVEDIGNNFIFNYFDGSDILDTPDIISSITLDYVSELFYKSFKEEYYALSIVEPIGDK